MASTALMAALKADSASEFWIEARQEYSGVADGTVIAKDLGPALWHLDFISRPVSRATRKLLEAMFDALHGSVFSFYAWNPKAQYPAADQSGALVAASAVKLNSVNADGYHLSLKGLPATYTITAGDLIAADHTGSKRGLYRALATVTASAGTTAEFEIWPAIRSGAAVNDVVTLGRAAAEMIIVPGTKPTWREAGRLHDAVSFQAVQV